MALVFNTLCVDHVVHVADAQVTALLDPNELEQLFKCLNRNIIKVPLLQDGPPIPNVSL